MDNSAFGDFFLVGGTALALLRGHRVSDDIDLFTLRSFEPNYVINLLLKLGEVRVTGEAIDTLNCFVNNIKVDLLAYKYPLIDEMLIIDNIRMAGIGDIAAM
jgi:hypothetical protein